MAQETIFGRYAREALKGAEYDELADGSTVGRVPGLMGVIAVAPDRLQCEQELLSVVEDWARLGVRTRDRVPVVGGVDLNTDEARMAAEE